MKTKFLIIIAVLSLCACKNDDNSIAETMAFNKEKWAIRDGYSYPYRDAMLADLMNDDKLKGLTKKEIVEKLGEPTRTDNDYIFYRVAEQRMQFITLHTKTLVLKLSGKGVVDKVMIHE